MSSLSSLLQSSTGLSLLRSIVDGRSYGLVLVDTKGDILFANAWFNDVMGSSGPALRGRRLYDFFCEMSHAELDTLLDNCQRGDAHHSESGEMFLMTPQGDKRCVKMTADGVFNATAQGNELLYIECHLSVS
ncbi:PAS domain-containing protein [Aestuariibacter halophilus]|uniref:PAS domain-containing protein n=1 Tax=Fluctibacter halophilus TaxID=226011 RepID=A0ABS8GDW6_9ALTE|nr:PAS domain-containing protein [Aestuariibacter halophilus]MCC2618090.1 PAS domain-containing protein [Aestuariibacter halophilus]